MKHIITGLIIMLMSSVMQAGVIQGEVNLESLTTLTKMPDYLEGDFVQAKYLKSMDITLDSSGKFFYQRDKSMRWETLEPIENELLMTPSSMVNKQGEKEITKIDLTTSPVMKMVSQIFFAVLTADWKELEVFFHITGSVDGDDWEVELVPVDQTLGQFMKRIELQGGDFLHQIVMHENGENRTTINFSNMVELSDQ